MSLIYFFILCIIGWSLASQSNSIRGFQDIEMRLPKLFNTNFIGKMMEFRWCCLSKANRPRLAFQLMINEHEKTMAAQQKERPFFQIIVAHFKHFPSLVTSTCSKAAWSLAMGPDLPRCDGLALVHWQCIWQCIASQQPMLKPHTGWLWSHYNCNITHSAGNDIW